MKPHDTTDIFLAPVALSLDQRLEELAELSPQELDFRIGLETGADTHSPELRSRGLLLSLTHVIDLHGWTVEWSSRGLRLSHEEHCLTLGLPQSLAEYLAE